LVENIDQTISMVVRARELGEAKAGNHPG